MTQGAGKFNVSNCRAKDAKVAKEILGLRFFFASFVRQLILNQFKNDSRAADFFRKLFPRA
jgi:hypothetical protein